MSEEINRIIQSEWNVHFHRGIDTFTALSIIHQHIVVPTDHALSAVKNEERNENIENEIDFTQFGCSDSMFTW